MKIYRLFLDGVPGYLARYYWWAYLWPKAVWFFDHQIIINAILFGQYKNLMRATLKRLKNCQFDRVLQLTCVYGHLTPKLIAQISPNPLFLIDVATVQLNLAQKKIKQGQTLMPARMNAENLGYCSNSFSTIILFFLLHEMPSDARRKTLYECMRTLNPGALC